MEYAWKHGIQIVSNDTFKTEDPLEVGKILVDLCTGDKYKILSVAKPRDRTRLPVLQSGPLGNAQMRRSLNYAKKVATLLRQSANPLWMLDGRVRCARVRCPYG